MIRHPSTLNHAPSNLRRLADACRYASHGDGCSFDDLQGAANALEDWAAIRDGITLRDIDGVEYPIPVKKATT